MVVIVYSTIDKIQNAKLIANDLVENKLVACVNIIPKIESIYRWKGKVEESKECVIIAKTVDKNVKSVISKIKELHPYELPDIVVIPIIGGLKEYLGYIASETS